MHCSGPRPDARGRPGAAGSTGVIDASATFDCTIMKAAANRFRRPLGSAADRDADDHQIDADRVAGPGRDRQSDQPIVDGIRSGDGRACGGGGEEHHDYFEYPPVPVDPQSVRPARPVPVKHGAEAVEQRRGPRDPTSDVSRRGRCGLLPRPLSDDESTDTVSASSESSTCRGTNRPRRSGCSSR